MSELTAKDVIFTLGLSRHPEGDWYAQTFEDEAKVGGQAHSTAIYYLLGAKEVSHWHRVDAVEVWHYYAGAPMLLTVSDGTTLDPAVLGSDIEAGHRPQIVVPRSAWQSAESLGAWTLVGCTVSPGFQFSGFELAPKDWEPGIH